MFSLVLLSLAALAAAAPTNSDQKYAWFEQCGQSKYADAGEENTFIVGGKDARPYEFPWQVSVRRTPSIGDGPARHFCGGMLIHPQWVLTAAHCMEGEETERMRIAIGEHDTSQSSDVRQIVPIESYFMHESYEEETRYQNDIALCKLSQPVELNENVQPVCAPEANSSYVGETGTVSGWGTLEFGTSRFPTILQWTNVPVITNEICDEQLGPGRVTDDMICAGRVPEYERDTCQGDSGGPLAVKRNGKFAVIGITSWGRGCATGTPGAYARTAAFIDWVRNKIGKN